jgi:hypothetical protein
MTGAVRTVAEALDVRVAEDFDRDRLMMALPDPGAGQRDFDPKGIGDIPYGNKSGPSPCREVNATVVERHLCRCRCVGGHGRASRELRAGDGSRGTTACHSSLGRVWNGFCARRVA